MKVFQIRKTVFSEAYLAVGKMAILGAGTACIVVILKAICYTFKIINDIEISETRRWERK